jgi:hypothetical protein
MAQKRYNESFGNELKQRLLSGLTFRAYFDKRNFQPATAFEEFSEVLKFNSFPERKVIEMLQSSSDFERGKILFETLSNLSRREASDIGLWNYLSHNELYRVVHNMWSEIENPPNKSTSESYILNHWIMTSSAQSELMDYPLSGLWWSFFLTVDEERTDKYELTRIFFKNLTFRTKAFGQSKIARHKEAVIGVLEFIKENGLDKQNFEDNGNAIVPYLNLLGGIKPLGAFDRTWFKSKLTKKFTEDIRIYGRLFRKSERKESLVIINSNDGKDSITTSNATLEGKDDSKKVICVWKDGFEVAESKKSNVQFQLEADLSQSNQSLFIIFKDGFVKKISGGILEVLPRNQKHAFTSSYSEIQNIFFTESNSLLLACFKNSFGKNSLKIFPGSLISDSSSDGNGTQINSLIRDLKVLPISNSYSKKTSSLIKNYPEAAFLYDSGFHKDEINQLRSIIEENAMY